MTGCSCSATASGSTSRTPPSERNWRTVRRSSRISRPPWPRSSPTGGHRSTDTPAPSRSGTSTNGAGPAPSPSGPSTIPNTPTETALFRCQQTTAPAGWAVTADFSGSSFSCCGAHLFRVSPRLDRAHDRGVHPGRDLVGRGDLHTGEAGRFEPLPVFGERERPGDAPDVAAAFGSLLG